MRVVLVNVLSLLFFLKEYIRLPLKSFGLITYSINQVLKSVFLSLGFVHWVSSELVCQKI